MNKLFDNFKKFKESIKFYLSEQIGNSQGKNTKRKPNSNFKGKKKNEELLNPRNLLGGARFKDRKKSYNNKKIKSVNSKSKESPKINKIDKDSIEIIKTYYYQNQINDFIQKYNTFKKEYYSNDKDLFNKSDFSNTDDLKKYFKIINVKFFTKKNTKKGGNKGKGKGKGKGKSKGKSKGKKGNKSKDNIILNPFYLFTKVEVNTYEPYSSIPKIKILKKQASSSSIYNYLLFFISSLDGKIDYSFFDNTDDKTKIKKKMFEEYLYLYTAPILIKIEYLELFYKRLASYLRNFNINIKNYDLYSKNKKKVEWNNISNEIKNELIEENINRNNWNKLSNENRLNRLSKYNYEPNLLENNKFNNNKNNRNNFVNSEITQKLNYLESVRNKILGNLKTYPINSQERNNALNKIKKQIINMEESLKKEMN